MVPAAQGQQVTERRLEAAVDGGSRGRPGKVEKLLDQPPGPSNPVSQLRQQPHLYGQLRNMVICGRPQACCSWLMGPASPCCYSPWGIAVSPAGRGRWSLSFCLADVYKVRLAAAWGRAESCNAGAARVVPVPRRRLAREGYVSAGAGASCPARGETRS